jgi:hypothetical protein
MPQNLNVSGHRYPAVPSAELLSSVSHFPSVSDINFFHQISNGTILHKCIWTLFEIRSPDKTQQGKNNSIVFFHTKGGNFLKSKHTLDGTAAIILIFSYDVRSKPACCV